MHIKIPVYDYRLGREGQSVSIKSYKRHYADLENVVSDMIEIYKRCGSDRLIRNIIAYRVKTVLTTLYVILFAMDCNRENKKKLVKIDMEIYENYPEIYSIMRNRIVRTGRLFSFLFYPIICFWVHRRYANE